MSQETNTPTDIKLLAADAAGKRVIELAEAAGIMTLSNRYIVQWSTGCFIRVPAVYLRDGLLKGGKDTRYVAVLVPQSQASVDQLPVIQGRFRMDCRVCGKATVWEGTGKAGGIDDEAIPIDEAHCTECGAKWGNQNK